MDKSDIYNQLQNEKAELENELNNKIKNMLSKYKGVNIITPSFKDGNIKIGFSIDIREFNRCE
jgi:hypothetical protein